MSKSKKEQLLKLYENLKQCTKCPISPHRCCETNNIVPGRGSVNAKLVLCGEAPGAEEDISSRPFVGQCGKMLDKMLSESGISSREVFLINTVKCRTFEQGKRGIRNRTPNKEEIESCKSWLRNELKILQPKVIVTLGMIPTKTLLGLKGNAQLKDYMGQFHEFPHLEDCKIMPCWHPSYVMRSPAKNLPIVVDILKKARGICYD